MPTNVHEFDWPDRVVVGTVGLPGERTFYLQVRAGNRIVSIALEKQQSALLADSIDEILDQLMSTEGNPFSIPTNTPVELVDNEPLEQPVEEDFRTGTMTLGWDPSTVQIVIEAYPIAVVDEEDVALDPRAAVEAATVDPEQMLLLRIPVGTARAFAKRTHEVVGAGRPICPLCGDPIDPDGHDCVLRDEA
jgi:uncharacterized repeat protein (TIGR03847 family)